MQWPLSRPHTLLLLVPTIDVTNLLTFHHVSYSGCLTHAVSLQQGFIFSIDQSATLINAGWRFRCTVFQWIMLIVILVACHRISICHCDRNISNGNEEETLLSHETAILLFHTNTCWLKFFHALSLVNTNTTDSPSILNRWSPPLIDRPNTVRIFFNRHLHVLV